MKIDAQKSTGIAVTNTVSCLAVVFLHCCAAFWVFQPTKRYDVNLVVQVLARFGVPCFLMITGATLFEFLAKYDVATYTRKRITRIVVPFLLWSEIFVVWHLAIGVTSFDSWRTFVIPLLNNSANGVYWYFYSVFGMYLFIPLLSAALIHMSQEQRVRWVAFVGVVFYVVNRLIPFARQHGIAVTDSLTPTFGLGYFDFCCLGYILVAVDIPKLWRRVLYLASCVMAVALFCWTRHENYAAGSNVNTFFQYDSFPGAVMAAAVFVFFLYFPYKILGEKFTSAIRAMSGLSY
ncbi:MAG: acyltransferase, partial [Propionibacteriaceae bacterium]